MVANLFLYLPNEVEENDTSLVTSKRFASADENFNKNGVQKKSRKRVCSVCLKVLSKFTTHPPNACRREYKSNNAGKSPEKTRTDEEEVFEKFN